MKCEIWHVKCDINIKCENLKSEKMYETEKIKQQNMRYHMLDLIFGTVTHAVDFTALV